MNDSKKFTTSQIAASQKFSASQKIAAILRRRILETGTTWKTCADIAKLANEQHGTNFHAGYVKWIGDSYPNFYFMSQIETNGKKQYTIALKPEMRDAALRQYHARKALTGTFSVAKKKAQLKQVSPIKEKVPVKKIVPKDDFVEQNYKKIIRDAQKALADRNASLIYAKECWIFASQLAELIDANPQHLVQACKTMPNIFRHRLFAGQHQIRLQGCTPKSADPGQSSGEQKKDVSLYPLPQEEEERIVKALQGVLSGSEYLKLRDSYGWMNIRLAAEVVDANLTDLVNTVCLRKHEDIFQIKLEVVRGNEERFIKLKTPRLENSNEVVIPPPTQPKLVVEGDHDPCGEMCLGCITTGIENLDELNIAFVWFVICAFFTKNYGKTYSCCVKTLRMFIIFACSMYLILRAIAFAEQHLV